MNKQVMILIGAFTVIIVLIAVVLTQGVQRDEEDQTTTMITPPATLTSPTPTGANQGEVTTTGTITDVGGQVAYKNATLIRVNDMAVYVTGATEIRSGTNNMPLTQAALNEGANVLVTGIPAEGGIEATQIVVLASAPVSPTLSPTPTQ